MEAGEIRPALLERTSQKTKRPLQPDRLARPRVEINLDSCRLLGDVFFQELTGESQSRSEQ